MNSNLDRFKKDLNVLIGEGNTLLKHLNKEDGLKYFKKDYEVWYSESIALVSIVLPKRKDDFVLYYNTNKGDCLRNVINHTPGKFIKGTDWDFEISSYTKPPTNREIAITLFDNQLTILKSVQRRLESSLFEIKQLLQADLFDNELDTAAELNKKGFVRGAGAIAGVVLEGHLSQVCKNHNISSRKKNPTINDFNQLLKDNEIIEVKDWRFIQHLGDLRNLCDHKKEIEPSKQDIEDLIKGVDKICKTLY